MSGHHDCGSSAGDRYSSICQSIDPNLTLVANYRLVTHLSCVAHPSEMSHLWLSSRMDTNHSTGCAGMENPRSPSDSRLLENCWPNCSFLFYTNVVLSLMPIAGWEPCSDYHWQTCHFPINPLTLRSWQPHFAIDSSSVQHYLLMVFPSLPTCSILDLQINLSLSTTRHCLVFKYWQGLDHGSVQHCPCRYSQLPVYCQNNLFRWLPLFSQFALETLFRNKLFCWQKRI